MKIGHPFRAFSHRPGHKSLIPGTLWCVTAYPAGLDLEDLISGKKMTWDFVLQGPVANFTVEQDFVDRHVRIFGEAKQGYFRWKLIRQGTELLFCVEQTSSEGVQMSEGGVLHKGDRIPIVQDLPSMDFTQEKLFLGNNQKKDWQKIRRKPDLAILLSLWHALGISTPQVLAKDDTQVNLDHCRNLVEVGDRGALAEKLIDVYLGAFSEGLVPRSWDEERQGIFSQIAAEVPVFLLSQGALLIRSLFFQEQEDGYRILPCLPNALVSGKMTGISTISADQIDLAWSKGKIRTLEILPGKTRSVRLVFSHPTSAFRIKKSPKARGEMFPAQEPLLLSAGERLYLDRFRA